MKPLYWIPILLTAAATGLFMGLMRSGAPTDLAVADGNASNGMVSQSSNTGPKGPCDGIIDGPVELTVTAHSSSDAYRSAVQAFNAGPGAELGVRVELLDLGVDAYEEFISAAAGTEFFPDVVDVDGPFLADFAWNGYVQPLGSCLTGTSLREFLPSVIAQGTYDGDLYSVGSFDSGLGLWAKESALIEVGARIPTSSQEAWTADEFEQILRDLQAVSDAAPLDIKWWYGAGEWHAYGFSPIVQSAGGDLINRDSFGSADGALNGPEAVGALSQFQRWAQDGLIDLEATDDTNFTEGDAAISWVGHWTYDDYSAALGDDLILLPLPDFGTGSVTGLGSWHWAMSSTTADPDAAWAFIQHMTSAVHGTEIARAEGAIPSRRAVLDADPSFSPGGDRHLYRESLEATPEVARPRPSTPAYGTIRDAFGEAFTAIVNGADVQASLDTAVTTIDEHIEANNGYRRSTETET